MTEGRQAGTRTADGPGGDEGRRSGGGLAPPARDRAPQPPLLRARRPGDLRRGVRRALPPPAGARGGASRAAHARLAHPARGRRAGDRVRHRPPSPAHALAAERHHARGDGGLRRAGAEVLGTRAHPVRGRAEDRRGRGRARLREGRPHGRLDARRRDRRRERHAQHPDHPERAAPLAERGAKAPRAPRSPRRGLPAARGLPEAQPRARGGRPARVREPAQRRRRILEAARPFGHRRAPARLRLPRRGRDPWRALRDPLGDAAGARRCRLEARAPEPRVRHAGGRGRVLRRAGGEARPPRLRDRRLGDQGERPEPPEAARRDLALAALGGGLQVQAAPGGHAREGHRALGRADGRADPHRRARAGRGGRRHHPQRLAPQHGRGRAQGRARRRHRADRARGRRYPLRRHGPHREAHRQGEEVPHAAQVSGVRRRGGAGRGRGGVPLHRPLVPRAAEAGRPLLRRARCDGHRGARREAGRSAGRARAGARPGRPLPPGRGHARGPGAHGQEVRGEPARPDRAQQADDAGALPGGARHPAGGRGDGQGAGRALRPPRPPHGRERGGAAGGARRRPRGGGLDPALLRREAEPEGHPAPPRPRREARTRHPGEGAARAKEARPDGRPRRHDPPRGAAADRGARREARLQRQQGDRLRGGGRRPGLEARQGEEAGRPDPRGGRVPPPARAVMTVRAHLVVRGLVQDVTAGHWLWPRFNGELLPDKPVLYHWLAALPCAAAGFSETAVRLPSALAGAALVAWTAALGADLVGAPAGLAAAALLATTPALFTHARVARPDVLLVLLLSLALGRAFRWWRDGERRDATAALVWLGAATFAKGPVAPVLFALTLGAFLAWQRELRRLPRLVTAPGLAAFAVLGLGWYAAALAGWGREFVHAHLVGRYLRNLAGGLAAGGAYSPKPLAYHLLANAKHLPAIALPWTPFAVFALWQAWRTGGFRDPRLRFLVCWAAAPVVAFTPAEWKLRYYLLPSLPALALVTAPAVLRLVIVPARRLSPRGLAALA